MLFGPWSSDFLEPVPEVVVEPALQDKKAILRNVEKTNPETLALAYDWEDTAQKLVRSQQKLKRCAFTFAFLVWRSVNITSSLYFSGSSSNSQTLSVSAWFISTIVRHFVLEVLHF